MTRKTHLLALLVLISVDSSVSKEASYYAFDGKGNNLIHEDWGLLLFATDKAYSLCLSRAVGELFIRQQVPAAAGYGANGDMSYAFSKSPREISYGLTLPAHRNRRRNEQHKTDMLTFIGQFFNHDIDLREEGSDDPLNNIDVQISHCDLRFNKAKCSDTNAAATSFAMKRSNGILDNGVLQQVNTITAYLDGSVVYGSDAVTADKLRSKSKGQMLMFNGELPKNTIEVTMANPAKRESDTELRAAGDVRANVNPILLAIQSLFLREHNRLAEDFALKHPFWTDEELYQAARKWNVAIMQSICFYEYIPLLGIQLPAYNGYKSTVNPGIDNFFATVSYRYGHSEVNDIIARVDDFGNNIDDDYITLMDAYFHPTYALSAGIEPLLRGASFYRQAEVSPHFASSLQNYLFGTPSFGGADLLAINIQRGRDHGMPTYNEARSALGLVTAAKFSDITSDVYLQKQLEDVYGTVDNVEPYVGGCSEDAYKEANFGDLFYTSLADQYTRIRDGDRFYFENEENGLFTKEEINEIRGTGLRDVILRNTNIQTLPQNIYISNPTEPWPLRRLTPTGGSVDPSGTPGTSTDKKKSLRDGVYDLEWSKETVGSDDYLRFKIICHSSGWVGLGIAESESSAMVGADIMIAEFSNGIASVKDYWAETFAKPVLDTSLGGDDDVELISDSEVDDITTVEFRRKVKTGDTYDREFKTSGATPIIFAWHTTSDALEYHTVLRRGKTTIDFFEESAVSPASSMQEAGSIMIDEGLGLSFKWKVETVSGLEWVDAKMQMEVSGPSWMGIVLEGPGGGLNQADFIKATSDGSGSCSIRDYWAEDPAEIVLDSALGGVDDTVSSFCYIAGGKVEFELKRPVKTSDKFDREFQQNGFTDVLFLWDDTTKDLNPDTMKEKRLKINFYTASWASATSGDFTSATPSSSSTTTTSPAATSSGGTPGAVSIAETKPASTSGEVSLDSGTGFVLNYELFSEDIKLTLTFKGSGFAAVGIPGAGMDMVDADVFVAVADDSGGCTVGDYWSTTFAAPLLDSENGAADNLTEKECAVDGDTITASFKRKLKTGDAKDRDIEPAKIPLIFAFSTSNGGLQYHGTSGRGSTEITPDLSVFLQEEEQTSHTGQVKQTTVSSGVVAVSSVQDKDIGLDQPRRSYLLAHSWLLGIGVGFFGVAGMCLERLGRGWSLWKKAHYSFQLLSLFFLFISEILALGHSKGDVEFAHCIVAYLLLVLSPFHMALCSLTYRRDRFVPAWKKLNRVMDSFICSMGFFQFWLALRLLGADLRAFQLFYAYSLSTLITFILTPRSSDKTKELPTVTTPNARNDHLENLGNDSKTESIFSKSITDKIAAKNAPQFSSIPQSTARKSSLIRATSRSSEIKIPAYAPAPKPSTSGSDGLFTITPDEFQEKINDGKLWTVIDNKVYTMEKMLKTHPGGSENIEDIIGKDGTDLYMEVHADSDSAHKMLAKHLIGTFNVVN